MDDDLAGQLGCPANCLASVCRLALVPYFSRQQQSLALAANTLFGLAGQQRERADLQLMRPLAAPDVSIILITACCTLSRYSSCQRIPRILDTPQVTPRFSSPRLRGTPTLH